MLVLKKPLSSFSRGPELEKLRDSTYWALYGDRTEIAQGSIVTVVATRDTSKHNYAEGQGVMLVTSGSNRLGWCFKSDIFAYRA